MRRSILLDPALRYSRVPQTLLRDTVALPFGVVPTRGGRRPGAPPDDTARVAVVTPVVLTVILTGWQVLPIITVAREHQKD